jgi:hypothetical protein
MATCSPSTPTSSIYSRNQQHSPVKVSCAVYVMDPYQAMTAADRKTFDETHNQQLQLQFHSAGAAHRPASPPDPDDDEARRQQQQQDLKMDALARADANQFLRDGFFQDPAMAQRGRDAARILVASSGHSWWSRPVLRLSHLQAQASASISSNGTRQGTRFSGGGKHGSVLSWIGDSSSMNNPPPQEQGGGAARDMEDPAQK